MSRIIAVVNHKGGVGKTTTTLNLGKALALAGKKVLLVDMDPQTNLSQSLGIEEQEDSIFNSLCDQTSLPIITIDKNFDLVPSDLELTTAEIKLQADVNGYFKLRKLLKEVSSKYDFIFIDCPPSLGILTINSLIAAKEIIICVQSQFLAVKGLNTILDLVESLKENHNPNLEIAGMLLTQTNNTVLSKSIIDSVKGTYKGKVFKTVIRQNIALPESSSTGQDIFTYDPECNGAKDYLALSKEFLNGKEEKV
ncbi:ParA family protein [Flexithrix dorotheae]|uniref:ParA family protein n=1 Tax=Flexithrix dorotheae TaxID=70993 RepID=UPI00036A7276|nr:ParA family protein [Flexithrix dorotheae]